MPVPDYNCSITRCADFFLRGLLSTYDVIGLGKQNNNGREDDTNGSNHNTTHHMLESKIN